MIQKQNIAGFDTYTIMSKDGSTQATIVPEQGGMVSSLIMPGRNGPRELLFHYPHLWNRISKELPGGLQFCFPLCGRLEREGKMNAYLYNGHIYEIPNHGFAWQKTWEVNDVGSDHILLTLRDDEQTRAIYPFHFTLELFYEIGHRRLFCRQTYTNHGDNSMPYYAGFQPFFLTPELNAGKNHVILNFTPLRRFRYNQRLTEILDEQSLFALPVSVTNPEIHQQLTELGEDKEIHLTYPTHDVLNMVAEGVEDVNLFPYLQIDSPLEEPFVNLSPWMGCANAFNSVAGARWLAAKHSEHGLLRLWLE